MLTCERGPLVDVTSTCGGLWRRVLALQPLLGQLSGAKDADIKAALEGSLGGSLGGRCITGYEGGPDPNATATLGGLYDDRWSPTATTWVTEWGKDTNVTAALGGAAWVLSM